MDEAIRARLGLPAPEPPLRKQRVFGFGLAVILLILAAAAWHKGRPAMPWELAAAAASALLAWLRPQALSPLYKPWMKAANWLGEANTFLIMAAVYYLALTPYAVVLRLLGRDLLDEKLHDRVSYWHDKGPLPEPRSYLRQF